MEIKQLNKETYMGRLFTVRYQTNGYYDIQASENGFQMKYVSFASPVEKSFDDVFFSEWLENPAAFGAFEGSSSDSSRVHRKHGTTAFESATSAYLTIPSEAVGLERC